jgi:N-acetylneuraminic acid mutarotase
MPFRRAALDTRRSRHQAPSTARWSKLCASMPTGREGHGAALGLDGNIYVIGGHDGAQITDANERFTP